MSDLGVDLDAFVEAHRTNARLAWAVTAAMAAIALWRAIAGDVEGTLLAASVTVLVAAPGPFYRSFAVTVPWEIATVAAAVVTWSAVTAGPAALYASVAVAALVAVLDLHLFTAARMSHRVAGGLVVIGTAAAAGAWVALRWAGAAGFGVGVLPDHGSIMTELLIASAAGLLVGLGFEAYVVAWEARLDRFTPLLEGRR